MICFFLVKSSYTKAQVTDTLTYLQQIVANKNNYIGKPFSTLEKDLQIRAKSFCPYADITYDISKETSTFIGFINPITMEDFSFPGLIIYWQPYLNHKTADSLYTKAGGGWTPEVDSFYSSGIIKDIRILQP